MIIANGCDLIEIARIGKAAQKEDFLLRIFTKDEREYAAQKKGLRATAALAAAFAAKEAVAKALGVGFGQIGWQDIEIRHDFFGKPEVSLSGRALKLAEDLQVKKIHLSISHSKECAMAMVILEG
mgnify:CR=1 FL=1